RQQDGARRAQALRVRPELPCEPEAGRVPDLAEERGRRDRLVQIAAEAEQEAAVRLVELAYERSQRARVHGARGDGRGNAELARGARDGAERARSFDAQRDDARRGRASTRDRG